MADVYCAEDQQLGRRVALKVLYGRFAEDDEFVERFRREASHAAGLQHQHVVSVYDRGEWEGTSYIAMEFVDGRTLKQLIQAEAPMAPLRAIDLAVQILRAARFAHRRGVIHRDMKPHNVIVEEQDPAHPRAKVTDFGIARAGASDMTQTGSIMGTAQYLSPEQAQGHAVTPQSDLYSVGICLYEMLTGHVPFTGESAVTIALKQVNEPPVPPSHFNAAIPAPLEDAVLRALAKNPEERFSDADAFIAALEDARAQIVAGNAPPAQPTAAFAAVASVPPATAAAEYAAVDAIVEDEPPPPKDDRPGWGWALIVGVLVVAGIIAALFLTGTIGGKKVTVPKIVGIDQAAAATVVHRDGLEVSFNAVTSDKPDGIVISQDPAPGTKLKEGETVHALVSSGPGQKQIPPVDGLTQDAATKKLKDAGFKVTVHRRDDATVKKGHVIETQPPGGSTLEVGSSVAVYVSNGPPQVTVPDVTGRPVDDARAALEDAGLKVGTRDQETQDKDPGTVLAQTPAANSTVDQGATVTLTVAKAPSQVDVPDVTGEDDTEAISDLQDAGFKISVEREDVDTPDQDGVVQAQDPKGGKKAKPGSIVTIVVGRFNPNLNPEGTDTTATTPTTT